MRKTTIGSLFVSFILLVGVVNAVTLPTGVARYWAITLDNSVGQPTSVNFTQMISFNAKLNNSAYSGFALASQLNNTEFFYSNGTIMDSWLEGNYTNLGNTKK